MTQKEMFQLASVSFSLMDDIHQGLVLIFFSVDTCANKGKSVLDCWTDAVYKVVRVLNAKNESKDDKTI